MEELIKQGEDMLEILGKIDTTIQDINQRLRDIRKMLIERALNEGWTMDEITQRLNKAEKAGEINE